MTSLEDARRDFYTTREMLKEVHTREHLEEVTEKLERAREVLWDIDPEFRAMVEENQRQAKIRSDEERAKHSAKIAEAESMASSARMKAEAARRTAEARVDDWVQQRRVKVLTPEEAEERSKTKMVCPICGASGKGNMVNGVPTCCHDQSKHGPWHKLVPEGDLKKYNRAYRRGWKKG